MSSSSESEEERERLRLALDPSFTVSEVGDTKNGTPVLPESRRRKVQLEWDPGHYSQTLKLTPETRIFLSKRLSEALTENIKFVKVKHTDHENGKLVSREEDGGIYLFSNSAQRVSSLDVSGNYVNADAIGSRKRQKPKFKRRKLADEEQSDDESEKLRAVAVCSEWVTKL